MNATAVATSVLRRFTSLCLVVFTVCLQTSATLRASSHHGRACFGLAAEVLGRAVRASHQERSARLRCAPRRRWPPIRTQVCALWPRVSVRERTYGLRAVAVEETSPQSRLPSRVPRLRIRLRVGRSTCTTCKRKRLETRAAGNSLVCARVNRSTLHRHHGQIWPASVRNVPLFENHPLIPTEGVPKNHEKNASSWR